VKYIILVGDGMSDYPLEELDGKTPLMVAKTPHMDFLARHGILGRVQTIPTGFPPGSDVANLSLLGYDPRVFYTGRAPLEAASLKLSLETGDVAFRCNLVTLREEGGEFIMDDFSAGHISSEDAREIIQSVHKQLGKKTISFYPGVSYRHIMVWKGGKVEFETTPPHDITGRKISTHLPYGSGSETVIELMEKSRRILARHPVNERLRRTGKKPANSIWLWGQGKPLAIPSFMEKYHCSGSVISAVDLIKGIGISAGLESISVPGATGYLDTNYRGKAEYAIKSLRERDFVFVHVEAPDEAAHNGSIEDKIKAIEAFDEKVVGTVVEKVKEFSSFRIMVLPDHATPTRLMTHASDPVPFVIYPPINDSGPDTLQSYDEFSARKSDLFIAPGYKLMDFFMTGELG
jgi:2,3-bisphosphoglycerate-independent phosphoglycerate mutase